MYLKYEAILDKEYFDEFNAKYELFSKYTGVIHEARELLKALGMPFKAN